MDKNEFLTTTVQNILNNKKVINSLVEFNIISKSTRISRKNSVKKNSQLENCMNYPLDLTTSFFLPDNQIKEEIISVLTKYKYIIQANNSNGIKAFKDLNKLSIQVLLSSEVSNLSCVFFKRIDGNLTIYRDMCRNVIKRLNQLKNENNLNEREMEVSSKKFLATSSFAVVNEE